ncbi:UNVERIFIED_CONTAM: hypothetical protein NCL1_25974 [Trichonephila clavipes]
MAVSNAENASASDVPLLLSLSCPHLHPFHRRQDRIILAQKSQSRHRLAFEIHSLLHHMPSRFLHLLYRILEKSYDRLDKVGQFFSKIEDFFIILCSNW